MNETLITDLQAVFHSLVPEAMRWLQNMVNINSFTVNREGVNLMGTLTAECFAPLGFSPEFVASVNPAHGRHLFLSRGNPEQRPVVLVTHLDTVFPPEEEQRNDFYWRDCPEEGRVYGPGTVDIKGGTVLIWLLLSGIRALLPDLFETTRWIVAANASEEVIGAEFGNRVEERAPRGARAVLVFEGGPREGDLFHLVTARKGRALYKISALGRAAHSGSAHADGANAIVALAEAVQAAAAITDYQRDLTVNVGWVGGGSVVNRVPQEACANLELRAFDPAILREGCLRIEALAGESRTVPGAMIRVVCEGDSPAWPTSQATVELAKIWESAARELGVSVKTVSRGGLSDANYLCKLGPTLDGLGPSGANAHCSERCVEGKKNPEFVEPSSFAPKATLNALAIKRLLSCT
jgi:glutamate carboxypeptidase